ncbi:MAG: phenylacetic acid degradation b [Flammeovirgaceae bacterium]|nr:phenylacetic acid degradation b [Flammeovirgaceae bacterium]
MKSLDPRVNRLPEIDIENSVSRKDPLDQLGTYEVFVQPKEGKPFQHEGALHASDREMAFVLAKESFTRRFQCISLFVVRTTNVFVSDTTEDSESVYDRIKGDVDKGGNQQSYEIFNLYKRGKQHVHIGSVSASSPELAMAAAKNKLPPSKTVYNIWTVKTSDIRFTQPDEMDLWNTLPDKKFRDASDYKGGDKLKEFLERSK